jgi:putative endonuclease
MRNNVQTGFEGQREAERYLAGRGMELLAANFRVPSGEIDLVARDGEYIAFIEVKYRKNTQYGLPREAVDARKQRRIRRTALHYIARKQLDGQDFRFDVIELLETPKGLQINHIENAF